MDVVHRFQPQIGQGNLFAARPSRENLRIKVACRAERYPARSDDVTRQKDRRRESMVSRLLPQVRLDRSLLNTVFSKGC